MKNRTDYNPVFFRTDNGKEPVKDWIKNSFNKKQREKIQSDIMFIVRHFPNIPKRNMICKLSGYHDIWEARIRLPNKTQVRILFLEYNSTIIFLHGFIKKDQKIPKKELKLASERKQKYLNMENDYEQESS